jgi:hypothetical protein
MKSAKFECNVATTVKAFVTSKKSQKQISLGMTKSAVKKPAKE